MPIGVPLLLLLVAVLAQTQMATGKSVLAAHIETIAVVAARQLRDQVLHLFQSVVGLLRFERIETANTVHRFESLLDILCELQHLLPVFVKLLFSC